MFSIPKGYHPLIHDESVDSEKQSQSEDGREYIVVQKKSSRSISTALLASVLLNIVLALFVGRSPLYLATDHDHNAVDTARSEKALDKSLYAGLTYDQPIAWTKGGPYGSLDLITANKTWEQTLDIDPGVIALHKSYAATHDLPPSSEFGWDKEKDIYYIAGFHDLHCVKSLHMAITEYKVGAKQTYELKHITHCLDALRQTVLCHAEDTPRLTLIEPWPENHPVQSRMCRSWDKLTAWARPLTACYKYINEEAKHLDSLERYKFCEPGSPYLPKVRAYWKEHFNKDLGF